MAKSYNKAQKAKADARKVSAKVPSPRGALGVIANPRYRKFFGVK